MLRVHDILSERFSSLREHPLFAILASESVATRTLQLLPYFTFWSRLFQDILSINAARAESIPVRSLLLAHREEDRGHELWFLHDLELIYGQTPDINTMFDDAFLDVRDFGYAFVAEVYRAEEDWERLLLLDILESGARIFLPALIEHYSHAGIGRHFQALGEVHLEMESAHAMNQDGDLDAQLGSASLDDGRYDRARGLIERGHSNYLRLAAILHLALARSTPAKEEWLGRRLSELRLQAGSLRSIPAGTGK